jgi:hypothetical protein
MLISKAVPAMCRHMIWAELMQTYVAVIFVTQRATHNSVSTTAKQNCSFSDEKLYYEVVLETNCISKIRFYGSAPVSH